MEIKTVLKDVHVIAKEPVRFSLNFEKHDKISTHYYDPRVLDILKRLDSFSETIELGKITEKVKYSDGKWDLRTTDYVPEDFPSGVLLLQVLNLSGEGTIIRTKYDKYLSGELHNKWKNSQVKPNDIVMAITGTIGRSALIPNDFPQANLNQALAVITLKKEVEISNKKIKIDPLYVIKYINSVLGRLQLERLGGSRAGQSGLSTSEIKSIKIPICSYEKQKEIVTKVKIMEEEAFLERARFTECINDIGKLLSNEINITSKTFKIDFVLEKSKIQDRLDCNFYHPEREYIIKELKKLSGKDFELIKGKNLKLITPINKKTFDNIKAHIFKYVDIGNTEKELGEITGFEEDVPLNLPSRAKQLCLKDDILQPRPTGSNEGVLIVPKEFQNNLFSTGFIQIRPQNEEESFLLWTLLKSDIVQKQFFYLQSGSTQPEITPNYFKEFVNIPLPKDNLRKKIISKSREKYFEAINHRNLYEEKIKEANNEFVASIGI